MVLGRIQPCTPFQEEAVQLAAAAASAAAAAAAEVEEADEVKLDADGDWLEVRLDKNLGSVRPKPKTTNPKPQTRNPQL